MSGVRKEETYRSSDAVYGSTGQHTTATGAKAEEMWHDVKSAVPGTKEHEMTHPATGASGMEAKTTTTHHTGGPTTGMHTATNPVTGETDVHSTQVGAKIDQAWKDAKQHIPGTVERKATTPSGISPGGTAGAGPGFTGDPLTKHY